MSVAVIFFTWKSHYGGDSDGSVSLGMFITTWVESMRTCWRSWRRHFAPTVSPSSGWDPARRSCSGLSSTVLGSTLSCGLPNSFPWSLLPLLRFVKWRLLLCFCELYLRKNVLFTGGNVRGYVPPHKSHLQHFQLLVHCVVQLSGFEQFGLCQAGRQTTPIQRWLFSFAQWRVFPSSFTSTVVPPQASL